VTAVVVTVVYAAVALILALTSPRVVDAVVVSTVVSHAATFVPILAGLYWRKAAPAAGFWAILCGSMGGLFSHFFLYRNVAFVGTLHPLFFGPLISTLVLILVTLFVRRKGPSQ